MSVSRPVDLFDLRAEMIEAWQGAIGAELASIFARRQLARPGLNHRQASFWKMASLFWVSEDMVDVLQAAAPRMPSQALHFTDPPEPYGAAVFAKSVPGLDAHPDLAPALQETPLPVGAICWWPAGQTQDDYVLTVATYSHLGEYLSISDGDTFRSPDAPPLVYCGSSPWPFGSAFDEEIPPEALSDAFPEAGRASIIEDRRLVAALWTLMQQRLAVTTQVSPYRAQARRLARTDTPVEPVRVVQLRRVAGSHDYVEGEGREYSHRWVVGGHWRNQFLPSTGGHRQQWISPYVKGPDDKPLVVKDKVYAWTR